MGAQWGSVHGGRLGHICQFKQILASTKFRLAKTGLHMTMSGNSKTWIWSKPSLIECDSILSRYVHKWDNQTNKHIHTSLMLTSHLRCRWSCIEQWGCSVTRRDHSLWGHHHAKVTYENMFTDEQDFLLTVTSLSSGIPYVFPSYTTLIKNT